MTQKNAFRSNNPVMRTPRSVDVEITSQCNLRCRYCYYFDNPSVTYQDLSTDEWLKFFDELGRCSVMDVTLQGGEPFIRKDLSKLIEGIVTNRMRFSILTNGGLIDDKIASYIAQTKRCNSVQVSVDGSCPEIHDICRGKWSFEGAIKGINILRHHDIPTTVRVTIHHYNVDDLRNIAHLLLDEIDLPGFSVNSAGYLGSCTKNSKELLLTTQDRETAMETLLHLSEKYPGRISAMAGPLAEVLRWRRMDDAFSKEAPPFPDGGYLTGCGCPSNKIAVRSDGAIIPCCMLAHLELGRINRDSLEDVWRQNPILNGLRQRYTISLDTFDFCTECLYISYCTGNCPGLAYTLTGQVDHPSPDACFRRFLEVGGELP